MTDAQSAGNSIASNTGESSPQSSKPSQRKRRLRNNPASPRRGTKAAKILQLLRRSEGASLGELTKATKWQPHSVRGFLSAMVKGRMRLKLSSSQRDDGERAYGVK